MSFRNIKLHNYNFKYTISRQRIVWCKNVYNGLSVILSTVKNIRWEEFEFNNECEISLIDDNDKISTKIKHMHTKPASLNYEIIGGAAYEILNKINYPAVNVRDFMDPTGDADIEIKMPILYNDEISNNDDLYDVAIPLLQSDGRMHTYLTTTIDWCFNKFLEQLNMHDLSALFPNSIPFDIAEYTEIPIESRVSDLFFKDVIIQNSHCHLVSFYASNMNLFKIQLVIKISDNNVVKIDHLVELLFDAFMLTKTIETKKFISRFVDFNNIGGTHAHLDHCKDLQTTNIKCDTDYNISNLNILLQSNFRAYEFRQGVFKEKNKTLYHKAINHIGRIIYLLELVINIKKYEKYKKMFRGNLQTFFADRQFIKSLLEGNQKKEDDPLDVLDNKVNDADVFKNILASLSKNPRFTKEQNKFIYDNLHLFFYKIGNNYKVKIIKIRVSDFLNMYLSKLAPPSISRLIMFAEHAIKGDPDDKRYNLFIKKIKQNEITARTRKFNRKESISSTKSDGEHKSREQNSNDLHDFKGIDSDESQFFSLESSKKDNVFGLGLKQSKKNKSKKYKK